MWNSSEQWGFIAIRGWFFSGALAGKFCRNVVGSLGRFQVMGIPLWWTSLCACGSMAMVVPGPVWWRGSWGTDLLSLIACAAGLSYEGDWYYLELKARFPLLPGVPWNFTPPSDHYLQHRHINECENLGRRKLKSRGEEKRRRKKIREEKESEDRRCRCEKSRKVAKHSFSNVLWPGGSKSRLAKAGGCGAIWGYERWKIAPLWREAKLEVKMPKTPQLGALLEVEMLKQCTSLWLEAHLEVKSVQNWEVRSTFGS